MSHDPQLFRAPANPEPPKDMYYQVPSQAPAVDIRPPPIFPWETNQAKPTRIFLEDAPPPASAPEPSETTPSVTTDDDELVEPTSPTTPTAQATPISDPAAPAVSYAKYSRTNAWDDMPEINRYISSLPQNRRVQTQVLLNNIVSNANQTNTAADIHTAASDVPLTSPPIAGATSTTNPAALRLTDFPTEIERPSLPVTPAPVRRPSFWGAERDESGALPGADGVPDQTDWDPAAKLAELARRQSEVLEKGPVADAFAVADGKDPNDLPTREVIGSASVPPPASSGAGEVAEGSQVADFATGTGLSSGGGTSATQSDLPVEGGVPDAPTAGPTEA